MISEQVEPEIKSTYEYVLNLKDRLKDTCELAQQSLKESSERYKKVYDRKSKPRILEVNDKVLILRPSDQNKLLMQWKGPFDVIGVKGNNDYIVSINGKSKTYHINLLKKYFQRDHATICHGLFEIVSSEQMNSDQSGLVGNAILSDSHIVGESIEPDQDDFEPVDFPSVKRTENVDSINIDKNLSQSQTDEIKSVIVGHKDIFTNVPKKTSAIECDIKLTTSEPIRPKPYPIPQACQEIINKEITDMLTLGVIERCESPYAHPIVMVKKKDGTNRFCIDFRKLNKVTIFDPEPMPNPDQLFSKLSSSNFFSKIDMTKGYWQIPLSENSKNLTAFLTPDAQYRFKYMPFGLVTAPAVFTRMMRKLFSGQSNVINYIDDILIYTETWSEHIKILEKTLDILQKNNLAIKPSKCFLGYRTVEFLGHEVGFGKLKTNSNLLQKIQDESVPKTKKELRSFLGLTGYYRKFVPNYAEVTVPLTDMTKKGKPEKLQWQEVHEKAFRYLKSILEKPPVLHLPDFSKTFVVASDASLVGLGAILKQELNGKMFPVAYASKKLLSRETNYSVIERECLAIVWAVKKFDFFLSGRYFEIETDHQPLIYISQNKMVNKRVMRWAMFLQEYRFRIIAVQGRKNHGPDYLSRLHSCQEVK